MAALGGMAHANARERFKFLGLDRLGLHGNPIGKRGGNDNACQERIPARALASSAILSVLRVAYVAN